MSSESILRKEICRVGRSLFERGYVHATAGNISARLDDGFLITPTDACLGQLQPERLARIDTADMQTGGDRASKTLALHRRIYDADIKARCVIHTHSTHLVALTLQGVWSEHDILPPITPYFVMKVGHVPLIPYHRPGDPQVGDLVAHRLASMAARGTPIRAVMLDRLGAWAAELRRTRQGDQDLRRCGCSAGFERGCRMRWPAGRCRTFARHWFGVEFVHLAALRLSSELPCAASSAPGTRA